MRTTISDGVWPTMITPYTESNTVDYCALRDLVEWYIAREVDGLFAVCQSSEMFFLSLDEKVSIARHVVKTANGRVPVVASGHTSQELMPQLRELKAMADTGIDALVLVVNRLAEEKDSEEVWKRNAEIILNELPDIQLGLYECPYPYKRLLSPELLGWCASTGRIVFLKDTSCDVNDIKDKVEAVRGKGLKVFNANAATLLESLGVGASGYSGVMANFHPELYVWLMRNWREEPKAARELQSFLGVASLIERQSYPTNAKYFLNLDGLRMNPISRVNGSVELTASQQREVEQLHEMTRIYNCRFAL
jgi:4-hydroxy-tetrahydrodipicolinate synthase